jgi:hypothetical protein
VQQALVTVQQQQWVVLVLLRMQHQIHGVQLCKARKLAAAAAMLGEAAGVQQAPSSSSSSSSSRSLLVTVHLQQQDSACQLPCLLLCQ